tara:strand:+ start:5219 stop:5950 length:732 start_codon:yes stop_codon:yes gene_type:complete
MATKTTSYRWTVNQGQDESLLVRLTDSSGALPDLSSGGVTATMFIKTSYSSVSAVAKIYSYTIAAGGSVTFASRPTANDTITLTDNAGSPVTKTYKASDATTSGTLDGTDVLFDTDTNQTTTAAQFAAAVNHSNGHNGSITATASGSAVTLTQGTAGKGGNTTITVVQAGSAISASNFSNGYDAEITLANKGETTINLTNEVTAALSAPSTFLYDIELGNYPSTGKVFRLLEGTVVTRPEITK